MEKGIISESKPKVQKVELDEEDSDFECHHKSEGKPVHVDIDDENPGKETNTSTTT